MKNSTKTWLVIGGVIVILFLVFMPGLREKFGYYKTPYPAQCLSCGKDDNFRSIQVPYVKDQDQAQFQPGRCSGNSSSPFYATVYNRDIYPPSPTNRVKLTGISKPPEQLALYQVIGP